MEDRNSNPTASLTLPPIPKWIFEIEPLIDKLLQKETDEHTLSETDVRNSIQSWINGNPFADKKFPVSTIPLTVLNGAAIVIKQTRHFERRYISKKQGSYSGKNYDNSYDEKLWDQKPLKRFQKDKKQWIRCGSVAVRQCNQCNGTKKIRCSRCDGKGKVQVTCPNCHGKKIIENPGVLIGGSKKGGIGGGILLSSQQCVRCQATGYIIQECSSCSGQGIIECPSCKGSGRIYACEIITATSKVFHQAGVYGIQSGMPVSWFKRATANISLEHEINGSINVGDDLRPPPKNGNVLFEKYVLTIVPFTSITFDIGKGKRVCFVGQNRKMRHSITLLSPKRIFFTIAAIIGIGVLTKFILDFVSFLSAR